MTTEVFIRNDKGGLTTAPRSSTRRPTTAAVRGAVALFLAIVVFLGTTPASGQSFDFGLHVRGSGDGLPVRIELARRAGAEAVPVHFVWDEAEPLPGRFELRDEAVFVQTARRAGLHVVGVLTYPSHLPRPTRSSSRTGWPSGHIDDWTYFVAHIVSTFRDDVDGWVVDPGRRGGGVDLFRAAEAEEEAAFVDASVKAVRRNDASAPVFAAVPGRDIGWLHVFARAGGMEAVDGLALDVNRWPAPPFGLSATVQEVRETAKQYDAAPSLWVWQFGYPTHEGVSAGESKRRGVDEATQATYVVHSHVRLLAAGVDAVFYDGLLDEGSDLTVAGDNFGLYTQRFREKASAKAYRTMTAALDGLHYAGAGDVISRPVLPSDGSGSPSDREPTYDFVFDDGLLRESFDEQTHAVAAHVFTGSGGTVIVMWVEELDAREGNCRDGCGHVNILPWLDGVPVRAFDMFGERLRSQDEWPEHGVPVYIELPEELVP